MQRRSKTYSAATKEASSRLNWVEEVELQKISHPFIVVQTSNWKTRVVLEVQAGIRIPVLFGTPATQLMYFSNRGCMPSCGAPTGLEGTKFGRPWSGKGVAEAAGGGWLTTGVNRWTNLRIYVMTPISVYSLEVKFYWWHSALHRTNDSGSKPGRIKKHRDVYVVSVFESATMDSKKSILFAKIPPRMENLTFLNNILAGIMKMRVLWKGYIKLAVLSTLHQLCQLSSEEFTSVTNCSLARL